MINLLSLQVDNLVKQHGRLSERARQRDNELSRTLDDVNQLTHDVEQTGLSIEQLQDDLSQQKPVAADIDVISQQQKHIKVRNNKQRQKCGFE